ncbi:S8 family serine peptidase [Phaeocystidibacter luteus]|uniref:S8 family serine peptidase n=1 Tax=Phaeocystidibacter luteus TaxID=911197 RepID=A0A6N6RDA8_9FLAO|nr:S8 family serine peptidase [Phaeocystidibacter luteus]KAB2807071.1 S8 family serine peptidase [Phaeocystidibacter luteus]
MNKKSTSVVLAFVLALCAYAQDEESTIRREWHHVYTEENPYGVATDQALEFLEGRESEEVIIAIMDSGIDTTHADLKSQLWVNEDEIPGNGIDDDGNGYIDDVHGWNFLGGENGNIDGETLELTRLYVKFQRDWDGLDMDSIQKADREAYDMWVKVKKDYNRQFTENKFELMMVTRLKDSYMKFYETVVDTLGPDYTLEDLNSLRKTSGEAGIAARSLYAFEVDGLTKEELDGYSEYLESNRDYSLNTEWSVRDSIIGDDPYDWNDSIYGNTDLMGQSSDHGTHVAGIVGAARNNGIGINGVAPNVKLMILRVVPDGDEYDKDVAMAIKYAVRNGAKVINMSFGKDYSPQAEQVQEVARWAGEHDVLLIHAAGNDYRDLDEGENYPHLPFEVNNLENETWIEVGANSSNPEMLGTDFSNYGKMSVDLFAPGEDIYSTLPVNTYGFNSGTSMAAPVVTGIAGLIRSYYPNLTAAQVKMVLIESAVVPEDADFLELSITGGIANALKAVQYIEEHAEELGINKQKD